MSKLNFKKENRDFKNYLNKMKIKMNSITYKILILTITNINYHLYTIVVKIGILKCNRINYQYPHVV